MYFKVFTILFNIKKVTSVNFWSLGSGPKLPDPGP
jgi:hypothetical protein